MLFTKPKESVRLLLFYEFKMKKVIFICLVLNFLFVFPKVSASDSNEFVLNINEIKRGALLTSKTRIGGNEMLDFELQVLSVIRNSGAKSSAILAEIKHPYFQENGVLSGMSGSPVYFNERLVGAIAFTSSFLKKPIVGITHIKDMLTILDFPEEAPQRLLVKKNIFPAKSLVPIKTPLTVNSSFEIDLSQITDLLKISNPVFSFGGGFKSLPAKSEAANMVPGDLIGVNLARGDINISIYGTLTYRDENRILAFGHPIGQLGKSKLALYQAFTDAVVPLQTVSYKVGSLMEEIGTINQDRHSGISGVIGEKSTYVPVKITMKTPSYEEKINFEIINDENYFIPLSSALIFQSYFQFEDFGESILLDSELNIKTDFNKRNININNQSTFVNAISGLGEISNFLTRILFELQENPYEKVNIEAIDLNLTIQNDLKYLTVGEVESFEKTFQPGDIVPMEFFLKRYRQKPLKQVVGFKLPKTLKEGEYQINVSSETTRFWNEFVLSSDGEIGNSLEQIFDFYAQQPANNKLNIWFFLKDKSLTLRSTTYKNLPFLKQKLITENFVQNKSKNLQTYFQEEELDLPLFGMNSIVIKVKKNVYD